MFENQGGIKNVEASMDYIYKSYSAVNHFMLPCTACLFGTDEEANKQTVYVCLLNLEYYCCSIYLGISTAAVLNLCPD